MAYRKQITKGNRRAIGDFLIAGFGAVVVVLFFLFVVFFVRDAPTQLNLANRAAHSVRAMAGKR